MSGDERIDLGSHCLRARREGGGSPHFLCLHGLVDRLEVWDRLAPGLASRGTLLRIDQRGHGQSDAPTGPYTREDLATDVVRVLDAQTVGRTVLVGHSMGGIVSMTTALLYPERVAGLVLLGTASHCNAQTAGWYERIALAGEEHGRGGIARAIYGENAKRAIVGDSLGISHVTRTLASLHRRPLTPLLPKLRCPVLLIVGENDPMGPRASRRIAEALPDGASVLQVLPGCGHWVHVEAPDAVLAALDAWLGELPPISTTTPGETR